MAINFTNEQGGSLDDSIDVDIEITAEEQAEATERNKHANDRLLQTIIAIEATGLGTLHVVEDNDQSHATVYRDSIELCRISNGRSPADCIPPAGDPGVYTLGDYDPHPPNRSDKASRLRYRKEHALKTLRDEMIDRGIAAVADDHTVWGHKIPAVRIVHSHIITDEELQQKRAAWQAEQDRRAAAYRAEQRQIAEERHLCDSYPKIEQLGDSIATIAETVDALVAKGIIPADDRNRAVSVAYARAVEERTSPS